MKRKIAILFAAALTMFAFAHNGSAAGKEASLNAGTNKVRIVMMSLSEWEKCRKAMDTHRHYEFEKQKVHLWVTNWVDAALPPRMAVPRDVLNGHRGDVKNAKPAPKPVPYPGQTATAF